MVCLVDAPDQCVQREPGQLVEIDGDGAQRGGGVRTFGDAVEPDDSDVRRRAQAEIGQPAHDVERDVIVGAADAVDGRHATVPRIEDGMCDAVPCFQAVIPAARRERPCGIVGQPRIEQRAAGSAQAQGERAVGVGQLRSRRVRCADEGDGPAAAFDEVLHRQSCAFLVGRVHGVDGGFLLAGVDHDERPSVAKLGQRDVRAHDVGVEDLAVELLSGER